MSSWRTCPLFDGMARRAARADRRLRHQPGLRGRASYLLREGEPADTFYVIRRGAVALETFVPQRGALVIETLHDGDLRRLVLAVPPYRLAVRRARGGHVHTLAFDGACLRGKCEEDHALGYDLMKRFAQVIVERLQATRLRLIDVYGHVAGG